MTRAQKIEKQIRSEKKAIVKIAYEINEMVFRHNLEMSGKPRFHLNYELGTVGNNIQLSVYAPKTFRTIEEKEIWLLNSTFEDRSFFPGRIVDKSKEVKSELLEMKKIAEKYIKLNCAS